MDSFFVTLAAYIGSLFVFAGLFIVMCALLNSAEPERITNGTAVYAGGETCNVSMDSERSRQAIVEDFKFCLLHHRIYLASE